MADTDRRRILVVGASGFVAGPVIRSLVATYEVWGAARFSNAESRANLEALGVKTVQFDLAEPDFTEMPDDVDYLVSMAVSHSPDFPAALSVNAENLGLLMARYKDAAGVLHFSTMAVYEPNGNQALREDDPLGDHHRQIIPTYSLSKIAAESVVRSAAHVHGVPTVIARLNVAYGDCFAWPTIHLQSMLADEAIPVPPGDDVLYAPIHTDDIARQVPLLLDVAAVPAVTVNWAGPDVVSLREWCRYLGDLVGKTPVFEPTSASVPSAVMDLTYMTELIGPGTVHWQEGMRRLVEANAPEHLVSRG